MPLDRFVLVLFLVIAAAGATVWLGASSSRRCRSIPGRPSPP
jgi:hypothetical protein